MEASDQRGAHDRGISMLGDGLHLAGEPMPNPQAIGRGVSFRNSATRASTSGAVSLSPVIPARANKYTKPRHDSRMPVRRDPVVAGPTKSPSARPR